MQEITYEITEKDRLKALAAAYKLAMIALRRGDPFPMVRFEWPELIITDPAELEEFGKVIDRPDNRDLRLDDFQVDAVRSVFDQKHTQVRISGGTKLGKGLITGGFIVNLWFDLYDDCKIVLVGPNTDHLKINMFGEAATWRRKMTSYKIGLNVPDVQKEKIEDANKPTHVIKLANTDSGEGMSGNHSVATLYVFDEASNAPDEYYMNALSQCKMLIGVSNPRAPSGWFYKGYEAAQFFDGGSMTAMASTGPMRLLSIGAVHCANVKAKRLMNRIAPPGGIHINGRGFKQGEVIPIELAKYTDPLIPGQVCYDKCEELKQTCSPDEKEWRVYGRFPRSSKLFQIFQVDWKKKLGAKCRQQKERILSRAIGVDVAGSVDGDYTTFAFGNEVGLADLYMMHQPNHAELSGLLAAIARERGLDIFDGSVPVAIDVVGIGKGLADFLEEKGCLIIKVSNGKIAERDTQTYGNRRAEVYGELSIAIDPDVNQNPWLIPDDHQYSDRIWQELVALEKIYMSDGRKWRLTPKRPTPSQRGKAVEDNRQALSEKLGRSPDCADAVSLLYQAVRELPEFEENFVLQFDPSAEVKEMLRDSRTGDVEVLFWNGKREILTAAEYERRFGKFGAIGNSESWEALKNQVFA